MNANEEFLLTMLILMLFILLLILMLLYFNTGYADTDADLCLKLCPCDVVFLSLFSFELLQQSVCFMLHVRIHFLCKIMPHL